MILTRVMCEALLSMLLLPTLLSSNYSRYRDNNTHTGVLQVATNGTLPISTYMPRSAIHHGVPHPIHHYNNNANTNPPAPDHHAPIPPLNHRLNNHGSSSSNLLVSNSYSSGLPRSHSDISSSAYITDDSLQRVNDGHV